MLYAKAKYYLEDHLERNEGNPVLRFWGCAMFSPRTGLLARFEYSEQFSTTDTSVRLGPLVAF
jgi:hypothetical protein